jgi:hypothetical protein
MRLSTGRCNGDCGLTSHVGVNGFIEIKHYLMSFCMRLGYDEYEELIS